MKCILHYIYGKCEIGTVTFSNVPIIPRVGEKIYITNQQYLVADVIHKYENHMSEVHVDIKVEIR